MSGSLKMCDPTRGPLTVMVLEDISGLGQRGPSIKVFHDEGDSVNELCFFSCLNLHEKLCRETNQSYSLEKSRL